MREAVIYRGEDGHLVAEVPSLPGCISQGENKKRSDSKYKGSYFLLY